MEEAKVLMWAVIVAVLFNGCIEIQVTQRVNTSAARNPVTMDSDTQGSTRVQQRKAGIDQNNVMGGDTTGAEK